LVHGSENSSTISNLHVKDRPCTSCCSLDGLQDTIDFSGNGWSGLWKDLVRETKNHAVYGRLWFENDLYFERDEDMMCEQNDN
jgi:hypothetical protein